MMVGYMNDNETTTAESAIRATLTLISSTFNSTH